MARHEANTRASSIDEVANDENDSCPGEERSSSDLWVAHTICYRYRSVDSFCRDPTEEIKDQLAHARVFQKPQA